MVLFNTETVFQFFGFSETFRIFTVENRNCTAILGVHFFDLFPVLSTYSLKCGRCGRHSKMRATSWKCGSLPRNAGELTAKYQIYRTNRIFQGFFKSQLVRYTNFVCHFLPEVRDLFRVFALHRSLFGRKTNSFLPEFAYAKVVFWHFLKFCRMAFFKILL